MRFTIFGMLGILLWGIALDGAEKNTTIGNPYGICAHLNRWEYKQLSRELELMKQAGIGNVRTDLDWNQLEAEKGKWNFERWDAVVEEAEKNGIAVLTFTNEATATIADRVSSFYGKPISSNHFIGTFSSFVHGYIAQRFGYKFYHIPEDRADKSFRVVDSDISPYSNQWLENYQLDFYLPQQTFYASQLNYRVSSNNWYVVQKKILLNH